MSTTQSRRLSWRRLSWRRLTLPLRIGLIFAALGMTLAIVGILRGAVPLNPVSILLALAISGGSWGVVSWAVATAVVDVENDLAEEQDE
jgi:hypothetical protein